jgi:TRAP-type C4-dicarboxylate transport system permease small subunit
LWIPQLAMAIGSAGLFLAFAEDLCRMIASQERNAGEPAEMLRVE